MAELGIFLCAVVVFIAGTTIGYAYGRADGAEAVQRNWLRCFDSSDEAGA